MEKRTKTESLAILNASSGVDVIVNSADDSYFVMITKTQARFLLDEGELPRLCAPLESLWSREGWHDGRALARIVARKL